MRALIGLAAVVLFGGVLSPACQSENGNTEPGQCRYAICYERSDGSPALIDGLQAWYLTWSPEVSSNTPWPIRPVYPGSIDGFVGILRGPYPESCIEDWLLGDPTGAIEVTVARWTKIQGFAPVVTQPAATECGGRVTQVVQAIDDALDATQVCRQPFPNDSACCVALTSVVGPDGQPLDEYWSASGSASGESWLPYECDTVISGDLRPGTVVVYREGYLPYIGCLDCGEYTIQLEPLP